MEFLTSQNLPIPSLERESWRLQSQRAFSFIEALREMSGLSFLAFGLFNFRAMNKSVCACASLLFLPLFSAQTDS